ncbi:glycoside hydrolase family 5 protein [Patulibacter sp. NPDC049589]|uniref:glycoside hydrolase family 5 protein n=1 Tax=Patulibacter sp. NPDC049589 TaxID=3154731 RepID=UPI003418CF79
MTRRRTAQGGTLATLVVALAAVAPSAAPAAEQGGGTVSTTARGGSGLGRVSAAGHRPAVDLKLRRTAGATTARYEVASSIRCPASGLVRAVRASGTARAGSAGLTGTGRRTVRTADGTLTVSHRLTLTPAADVTAGALRVSGSERVDGRRRACTTRSIPVVVAADRGPVAGAAATPAGTTTFAGLTRTVRRATRGPVVVRTDAAGKRAAATWDVAARCSRGADERLAVGSGLRGIHGQRIRAVQSFSIRGAGGVVRSYRATLSAGFHADGVAGTVRTRVVVRAKGRRAIRCDSGTRAFDATVPAAAGTTPGTGTGTPSTPTSPADASPTPPLTTSGNRIMRSGVPFRFRGVNRDSLEWGPANYQGCGGDGHFTDHDFDVIASWKVTAIRLPLSQAGWLGRRCSAADYARWVDDAVAKANARGIYAILDLHWTDVEGKAQCDGPCLSGQQTMPDADSLVFWRSVAARYANRPGVIFDLFNEPHDVSWACWRDGGCTTNASLLLPVLFAGTPFQAVGMQQLYDAVRAQGAQNLVLVAGLQYAYDLSGVLQGHALKGTNIAYDTHVYTAFHSTVSDWDQGFGRVAAKYPVVSTEFGTNDCSAGVTQQLLRYFDKPLGSAANSMGWTIWSWNAPGSCQQPSVIADWEGTPLGDQGKLIKSELAAAAP